MEVSKKEFNIEVIDAVLEALKCKYLYYNFGEKLLERTG